MTQTYNITGMTCNGCLNKVQTLLQQVDGVSNVSIDLAKGEAEIEMNGAIPKAVLMAALQSYPKYQITEAVPAIAPTHHHAIAQETNIEEEEKKSWVVTYKPILLIFAYILGISIISADSAGGFNTMVAMRVFMAGFFLTFSFFKMLDISGFADSYSMYDIVAKKFRIWGYLYVFIEALLGISYSLNFQPFITNIVTLIVMAISIAGVLKSVMNKSKIRCACLGAVFNLPMSTVTIIEDALMILMSAIMLSPVF
jgi:copper chaperone CopZ